jgi:hypothetical protein
MKLRTARKELWIPITLDGETAQVLIRPLNPKETQALLAQATDSEWERNQRFEKTNFYTYRILKIDAVIREWKDVVDEQGAPIPCTRENKEVIYLNNPGFIEKILDEADKLSERIKDERTEQEKN